MAKQTIYTVGGTVQAGGGIYIKRKADDELLELCRQGEFAFILSSRQVGKSSLMVRTAQQLEKENIRSVTIDLSAIGVNVSQDEWYLGILNEVATTLNLETDIFDWWKQYAQLGPAQRLSNFFRDVLLKEVKEQIVLFFDEIDSTLSISFSDDFYIALRAVYNARSTNPDFKRLSFVLVGVAAPSDLISDNKRTPFNIGHRVEVNDFTLAEALPLANGLGEQAVQALTWVFQYTGGHPYLTQRICAHLATSKEPLDDSAVANAVERLFTGEQGKQDNNLQFVRDMLSKRSPDVSRVLLIYRDIRSGKKIIDDERSIAKAHLKLSGLVRSEKGILRVRNEIYNTVFNPHWVQENIPKNWQRVALISLSAVLGILILGSLAVFVNDYFVGSRRDQHFRSFISASSPERRLSDLAEIYRREGILSNKDSDLMASQLFYGLSTADDQLALFKVSDIHKNIGLQKDLVVVINHLQSTVANVDLEIDNTQLLQTMLNALMNVKDDPVADNLRNELNAWIAARKSFEREDYVGASASYTVALTFNPNNHSLLYERAKVNVALKLYANALQDLDATIETAKQSAPNIPTPVPTSVFTETIASSQSTSITSTAEAQITRQTNETRFPTAEGTALPSEINTTLASVITPALEPTLTPAPTITPTAVPTYFLPPKYKSNFTTLIDIVNAVQALIESTPQLQIAMQPNGGGEYGNLQSFGLVQLAAIDTPTANPRVDFVVFISGDSALIIWDLSDPNNPEQLATLKGYLDKLARVAFSPDGKFVLTGSDDSTARVWEVATGKEIARMTHSNPVYAVDFSPDGNYVVSGSGGGDNTARVWEAATGQEVARMTHDSQVLSVAFSPDGKYIVSGSRDNTARVWEAATGQEVTRMTHDEPLRSAAFSPDGKYVVSGSDDDTARVWEAATGQEVARMTHDNQVLCVAFSPNGKYIVSGSRDNTARVWEAATGQEVARMTHDSAVFSVALSADGKYVVSGSADKTARVWEAATGREVARMTSDFDVYSVAFSPDGKYVVSRTSGGLGSDTIVWDIITGVEIANLTQSLGLPTVVTVPTFTPGPVIAQIPSDFPGTFIRVREYPDLSSTIVGSVQAGDQVLVTAYTFNGWIWYRLDVPDREIMGVWISGVIEIGGENHVSVISSTDIRSNAPFITLDDVAKP